MSFVASEFAESRDFRFFTLTGHFNAEADI